jgi:hypothetical protein
MKVICDCDKEMKDVGQWPKFAAVTTDEVVQMFHCEEGCGQHYARLERPGLKAVRDPDDADGDIRWHIETRT